MTNTWLSAVADARAVDALDDASPELAQGWSLVQSISHADAPPCGLAAGDRPAADVEVLASTVAAVEFELARRMHAARVAGGLPLHDPGAMLAARGWSLSVARRLARAGGLAAEHPGIASAWAAGLITCEHLDPIARVAERFTCEELAAVVAELGPHWGRWSPAAISRFVVAADRLLHPPPDPDAGELDAYQARNLSFALTQDSILIAAQLPRVEGELVIAAIDALAERLRSAADHVPAGARRADALVALVGAAVSAGTIPTRSGLPVGLTVTLSHTDAGDPVATTGRGHQLTEAEVRWACCDARITPVLVGTGPGVPATVATGCPAAAASPTVRIAALAALLFDTQVPLAVGRTSRTATPAQRRALAVRDRGCLIPGCPVPAEACQAHHLTDWAEAGETDIENLALLCWAHHRQVDLKLWTISPTADPPPLPGEHAAGVPWPANNGAPFQVTRPPRHVWRSCRN